MGDWLIDINGHEISYDNVGNPLNYVLDGLYVDFTWEGRQLVAIDEGVMEAFSYSYEYNDEGIRTSKTLDAVQYKYTLNGSQIVSQEWSDKLMIFFYDDTGAPIGYAYRTTSMAADTFYYYVYEKNLQGDIVAIYNTSGEKLVSYKYDAWGNVSVINNNISGTNAGAQYNPFRYRGYYYDEETKLYYLNSRYYDPSTGRFLNADDINVLAASPDALTDKNLYAYCDNNPIMRADNGGEFWNIVIGAAVGGLIGGITSAITQVIENDGFDNFSWARLAVSVAGGAVSGGLAATGMLVGGQMIANGLIGATTAGIETWLTADKNTTTLDYVYNIAIGAGVGVLAGRIGGNGTGNKHLSSSAGQAIKRVGTEVKNIFNQGVKNTFKEIGKAGKYYYSQIWKQSIQNGSEAIVPIIKASIPNFAYNVRGVFN